MRFKLDHIVILSSQQCVLLSTFSIRNIEVWPTVNSGPGLLFEQNYAKELYETKAYYPISHYRLLHWQQFF